MPEKDKLVVNYEVDEDEALDEIEQEIEVVDQDYLDDDGVDEQHDDISRMPTAEQAEQQKRVEELRSRLEGGESQTAEAMKEVVEQLRELRQRPQTPEKQEVVEDLEALRKKLADGFYDDPMASVDMWLEKRLERYEREKLQPAFQQIAGVVRDTALDSSKRAAKESDTGKFVMDRYLSEVEQLVSSGQVQVGPGAYDRAVKQVAMEHLDEFIDWKVEQKAAQQQQEQELPPARGANPSARGQGPRPSSTVKLSRNAEAEINRIADSRGIDRDMFRESFVRLHPDKVREMNRRR